ncbi:MFS transporter [Hyphococcus sp.]|uniref:MFS transporter n=1 Tax=Hyphococcus sp. TaxID=2038636 RepID=UPI003D0BED40
MNKLAAVSHERADPSAGASVLGVATSRAGSLLAGLGILVLGNSLYATLMSLRAHQEGFNAVEVGALSSLFFAGYIFASYMTPKLIMRLGMTRSFAALASLISAIVLMAALHVSPLYWFVLRFVHGALFAAVIIIAESWLNAIATTQTRGRILALYGVIFLFSFALGQLLIVIAPVSEFRLFNIVSILFSIALLPVLLGRQEAPLDLTANRMKASQIFVTAPAAIAGCAIFAAVTNGLAAVAPVQLSLLGFSENYVAIWLFAFISGGLVAQWPIGVLSDHVDRRLVGFALFVSAAIAVGGVHMLPSQNGTARMILGGLLGAATIPAYSVFTAQIADRIAAPAMLSAVSTMIVLYALGAMSGPILLGLGVNRWGPAGLSMSLITLLGIGAVFMLIRLAMRRTSKADVKEKFYFNQPTSHIGLGLDPRTSPSAVLPATPRQQEK